jgi:hypothetical protein
MRIIEYDYKIEEAMLKKMPCCNCRYIERWERSDELNKESECHYMLNMCTFRMLIYMGKCLEWKEELFTEISELYESEGRRNLRKWKRKVLKYPYEDLIYLYRNKQEIYIMTAAIGSSLYYEFSFKKMQKMCQSWVKFLFLKTM